MAEDHLGELRNRLLSESLQNSHEPKWGYFGFSSPLAIGDNSLAPSTRRKVMTAEEEAAEPIRNILTGPSKKGAGPDVYFSFAPPLCIDDPYIDPMLRTKRPKLQQLDPDASFKPPGMVSLRPGLGYEYLPHMNGVKDPLETAAKYKDYTPIRNFYTNPAKKGGGGVITPGVLFGTDEERRFPEHEPDDYDAPKKLRLKELAEHQSKMQELPFKSTVYGMLPFQSNEALYATDQPTGIPRETVEPDFKKVEHENPFKPSNPPKKGYNAYMSPFPEHMPDPAKQGAVRKQPEEGVEPPPAWRPCHPQKSANPMPSVTSMVRNMRAERPSAFVRPRV